MMRRHSHYSFSFASSDYCAWGGFRLDRDRLFRHSQLKHVADYKVVCAITRTAALQLHCDEGQWISPALPGETDDVGTL